MTGLAGDGQDRDWLAWIIALGLLVTLLGILTLLMLRVTL